MSDIYNDHQNAELQSHSEILELAAALSADGIYYSEREQLINDLTSRRFHVNILVNRVSNTYSTVPDESLRKGRTIQGEITDTEIEVKIQLPESLNEQVDRLSRGDTFAVEGIVNRWVSGLDQFEIWGLEPQETTIEPVKPESDDQAVEVSEHLKSDGENAADHDSSTEAAPEASDEGLQEEVNTENNQTDIESLQANDNEIEQLEKTEELTEDIVTSENRVTEQDQQLTSEVASESEPKSESEVELEQEREQEPTPEVERELELESSEAIVDVEKHKDFDDDAQSSGSEAIDEDFSPLDLALGTPLGLLKSAFTEEMPEPFSGENRVKAEEQAKSHNASSFNPKACFTVILLICAIPTVLVFAGELISDWMRTSSSATYTNPASHVDSQTYDKDATAHVVYRLGNRQITIVEAMRLLLPRTTSEDAARKAIVQQFATTGISNAQIIHDNLTNAPIEFVAPLFKRLNKAMTHPWSTPKHKPLLTDVITRIKKEGASFLQELNEAVPEDTPQTPKTTVNTEQMARAKELAAFFFDKLDTNGDGVIDAAELANADNPERAANSDRNGDGQITLDELVDDTYRKIDANPDIDFSKY